MKTIILSLNSKYIHSSLAPWYLKAAVKAENADAEIGVVESTINRAVDDTYLDIIAHNPQLLACSCYIWNIEKTLQLAKRYKEENPTAYVVLGGPEVGYRAEAILRDYPFVDAVISGEGEKPMALLYSRLSHGGDFSGIEGISYRTSDGLVITEPYITQEEPPDPYSDGYMDALKGRIAYIEGSRGCPYSCAFCLSGRCGTVRYFGLSRVKNDIIRLGNSGAKTVKFVDRTFNANRKRALEIWSFIIENSGKLFSADVCFHFEIAGDLLDDEAIELLKTAPRGLIQVEIGVQSFNETALKHINRKTDSAKLYKNIKALKDNCDIHIHVDLIAGLPYEDIKSFEESFNKAFALRADNLQLGFLKLLHGAPMREKGDMYPCQFTVEPPYEVTETPWLSQGEIVTLKNTEDALERIYNSGRFTRTLEYLTETLHFNPFKLFYDIGNYFGNVENISLNEYFAKLYERLSMYKQTDNALLRDLLVADKLLCDPSGYIPDSLRVKDPRLKKCKAYFEKRFGGKGIKLGVAITYTGDEPHTYCVNYSKKDSKGNYQLIEVPLDSVS